MWGPLVGVIPFVLIWELIAIYFPSQTTLLLGVCFLLIVYVIPNGITGLIEDAWHRRAKWGRSAPGPVQRALDGSAGATAGQLQPQKSERCLTPRGAEALSAAAVTKRFGGLVAVEDMSFRLPRRKFSA